MILAGFDVSTKGIARVILGSHDPFEDPDDGILRHLSYDWWPLPKLSMAERPSFVFDNYKLPTVGGASVAPCYIEQPMGTNPTYEVDLVIGGLLCAIGGWRALLVNISTWKGAAGIFPIVSELKKAGHKKDVHKIAIALRAGTLWPELQGQRQDVLDAACIAYAGWLWSGGKPMGTTPDTVIVRKAAQPSASAAPWALLAPPASEPARRSAP